VAKFQIFKDSQGEYRWLLRADNGEPIAGSGEGYKAKADCQHGIDLVKKEALAAPVEDES
jgi:uncharacterized protein